MKKMNLYSVLPRREKVFERMCRLVLYVCVCLFAFSLCFSSCFAEENETQRVSIEVSYYDSGAIFFTDEDVDFYIDGKYIDTVESGTVFHKTMDLKKGKHKVKFAVNKKVKTTKILTITDEKYIVYSLYSNSLDDYVKAFRCKTDIDILESESHPKVLDSINDALYYWGKYGDKRVLIEGRNWYNDVAFPQNIIVSVDENDSGIIDDLHINIAHIDGGEDLFPTADEALKFIRKYVNMDKLEAYYDFGYSYKVFSTGKESDSDPRTYEICYYANEEGKTNHCPYYLYVKIHKNSLNDPVNDIRVWWGGTGGSGATSNYTTCIKWDKKL